MHLPCQTLKNIEHRDIKLWNIHVEKGSGRVVILDLGVGRKRDMPPRGREQQSPTSGIYPSDARGLADVVRALLPTSAMESAMQTISSQLFGLSMALPEHTMSLANPIDRPHVNVLSAELLDRSTLNEADAKESLLQLIRQ